MAQLQNLEQQLRAILLAIGVVQSVLTTIFFEFEEK
jgi:hypothetical protein